MVANSFPGDHSHSWAFDGLRAKKWNVSCEPYGRRWHQGDVIGTLIDMDLQEMRFYINGEDLGPAFYNFSSSDLYPALSLNVRQCVRVNFGQFKFIHPPDEIDGKSFRSVSQALSPAPAPVLPETSGVGVTAGGSGGIPSSFSTPVRPKRVISPDQISSHSSFSPLARAAIHSSASLHAVNSVTDRAAGAAIHRPSSSSGASPGSSSPRAGVGAQTAAVVAAPLEEAMGVSTPLPGMSGGGSPLSVSLEAARMRERTASQSATDSNANGEDTGVAAECGDGDSDGNEEAQVFLMQSNPQVRRSNSRLALARSYRCCFCNVTCRIILMKMSQSTLLLSTHLITDVCAGTGSE